MNKYTLWQILDQYDVVIPMIQRDYAQGRQHDVQIEQIRMGFIQNLFTHLVKKQPLALDFVYGAVQNKQLRLLDGQQRLTTLFLLHWYIAIRTNVPIDQHEVKKRLAKFSYQTRISSKHFILALIENGFDLVLKDDKERLLSQLIQNEAWYFSVWQKDPTVQSMLTMLDEIDRQYKDLATQDKSDLWSSLTQKHHVHFYFLPMQDFNLSDELYIRMNARGVQLTEFENFKAWLLGHLEKSLPPQNISKFFNQIDQDWTDYLWNLRKQLKSKYTEVSQQTPKQPNLEFDAMFMQIFKSCLLYENYSFAMAMNSNADKTDDTDQKSLVNRLRKNAMVSLDELQKLWNDNKAHSLVQHISNFFDFLLKNKHAQEINSILSDVFRSATSSYEDQVRFSIIYYFIKYAGDHQQFDVWLYIVNKLIANAKNYYNNEKGFIYVLEAVETLAQYIGSGNVLQRFVALENDAQIQQQLHKHAFDKDHLAHEIEKTKLILKDPTWQDLLRCYEEHDYFYGQIDFLLQFAKDDHDDFCQQQFKHYANLAAQLFTPQFLEDKNYLLQRSLLSVDNGNYLIKDGANLSFCQPKYTTVRLRNENWRKVFADDTRRGILKLLLDQLKHPITLEQLQQLILANLHKVTDWRQYFIQQPQLIQYCKYAQIRFESEHEIYLLRSVRRNGTHAELRTYALYHLLCEQGLKNYISYYDVSTTGETSGICFKTDQSSLKKIIYTNQKFEHIEIDLPIEQWRKELQTLQVCSAVELALITKHQTLFSRRSEYG